jgi:hypothetical protein
MVILRREFDINMTVLRCIVSKEYSNGRWKLAPEGVCAAIETRHCSLSLSFMALQLTRTGLYINPDWINNYLTRSLICLESKRGRINPYLQAQLI